MSVHNASRPSAGLRGVVLGSSVQRTCVPVRAAARPVAQQQRPYSAALNLFSSALLDRTPVSWASGSLSQVRSVVLRASFEQAERSQESAAPLRSGAFGAVASPAAAARRVKGATDSGTRVRGSSNLSNRGGNVNKLPDRGIQRHGGFVNGKAGLEDSLCDSEYEGYGNTVCEEDPGAAYEARLELGRAAGELGALSVDDYYFMKGGSDSLARNVQPRGDEDPRAGRVSSSRPAYTGSRNNITTARSLQNAANERASRAASWRRDGTNTEGTASSRQERSHWRPADLGPKPKHDWPAAQAHLPPEPQPIHNTGRLMVASSSAELPPAERTFNARVRQCMHAVQVGDVQTRMTRKMSQAVDSYTDALRLHSLAAAAMLAKRAEAHAGVAEERHHEGVVIDATLSWEACLADAIAACSLDPNLEMGHFWKGQALLKLGEVHRAADAFHDGLQVNPLHDQLRQGLEAVNLEASGLIADTASTLPDCY